MGKSAIMDSKHLDKKTKKSPAHTSHPVWIVLIPIFTGLLILAIFVYLNNPKHSSNNPDGSSRFPISRYPTTKTEPAGLTLSNANASEADYLRLPKSLRPLHYKLSLIPFLEESDGYRLSGRVRITCRALTSTSIVVLHAKNLTINESSLEVRHKVASNASDIIPVKGQSYDPVTNFYEIRLAEELVSGGIYKIFIEFESTISDDLKGFYKSSYVDKETNMTRWVGVSQFEPTDARRAFPCFDEPELKAEFQINIARPENRTSLSNMNLRRSNPFLEKPDWVWDHYATSPPMSTYLVAFVVSDFSYLATTFTTRRGANLTFRVWARRDAIEQAEYALKIGPKIVPFFERYLGVDFPLPKLDMVAVPDFDFGAMENWGLIVFKEAEMLFNPNVTSMAAKDSIASTITHEISHHWFGDLVTMSWWSDIWLNEGFASYFEYVGVNYVEPTWNKMELLVNNDLQDVLRVDVLESAHPVSVPVADPDEINELFDTITYSKGAAIVGMMNHFLTPTTFRHGLKRYLTQWRFNNTVSGDLWTAFTEQAHADRILSEDLTVAEIMETWTVQKGYPLVHVQRNYELQTAIFTQQKYGLQYTSGGEQKEGSRNIARWWIPISYASPQFNANFSNAKAQFWLSKADDSAEKWIPAEELDCFVVNVNQTGYYRVNYDMRNWQLISNQLKTDSSKISILNRAQIIDDALNLAQSSLLPYDFVFTLAMYLRDQERDFSPWESFLDSISYMFNMLDETPAFAYYKSYLRHIVEHQYDRMNEKSIANISSSSFQEDLHTLSIVAWACTAHNADCIRRAKEYFEAWTPQAGHSVDNQNPIPVNLRKAYYCSIVENGGDKEWNFLWARYLESNTASEQRTMLKGLACSRSMTALNNLLDMALNESSAIRKQDGATVLREIGLNPVGTHLVFNLLNDKWTSVEQYLGAVDHVVDAISDQFNTQEQLTQMLSFKSKYEGKFGSNQRSVSQAVEKIQANIDWMARHYDDVFRLLQKYVDVLMV